MDAFPQTLKTWRAARRFSQLDLANEAEISSRHLSFLETGRARPSREMIAKLSDALHLPLEARNQMLTHAGFAIRYKSRDWSDQDMAPIRQAVERMLSHHMPYPGLALDRLWCVQSANAAALALFGGLGVTPGDSLLELMTSRVLQDHVENWPRVAQHTASRLRVESLAQAGIPELEEAARLLSQIGEDAPTEAGPVIPITLRQGDMRLSMFSTIAQFGTPEDVTLDDLKIELFFPNDETTAQIFEAMAAG